MSLPTPYMSRRELTQHWRGSHAATLALCRRDGTVELGTLEWSDVPRWMRDNLCKVRACKLAANGERRICDEKTCRRIHGITP